MDFMSEVQDDYPDADYDDEPVKEAQQLLSMSLMKQDINKALYVGTHEDCTHVLGKTTTAVPTVNKKYTMRVSKDTVGGGTRDRRATCSPVPALRKTYASALRGK
jgi:hypothetical protein